MLFYLSDNCLMARLWGQERFHGLLTAKVRIFGRIMGMNNSCVHPRIAVVWLQSLPEWKYCALGRWMALVVNLIFISHISGRLVCSVRIGRCSGTQAPEEPRRISFPDDHLGCISAIFSVPLCEIRSKGRRFNPVPLMFVWGQDLSIDLRLLWPLKSDSQTQGGG